MVAALFLACFLVGYKRQPWWAALPLGAAYVAMAFDSATALGTVFYSLEGRIPVELTPLIFAQTFAFSLVAHGLGMLLQRASSRAAAPPPSSRCAAAACLGAAAGLGVGAILAVLSGGGGSLAVTFEFDGAALGALLAGCFPPMLPAEPPQQA